MEFWHHYAQLPKRLTSEETESFIQAGMTDKAILGNMRFVIYLVNRYQNSAEWDDLVQIGSIGLIKSVKTFDVDKNIKFSTYAATCIQNEIFQYFRKQKKHINNVSLNTVVSVNGENILLEDMLCSEECVDENILKIEEREEIMDNVKKLNHLEKTVLLMRYTSDDSKKTSQCEIAKTIGVSQSYISRVERAGIQKLKNMMYA